MRQFNDVLVWPTRATAILGYITGKFLRRFLVVPFLYSCSLCATPTGFLCKMFTKFHILEEVCWNAANFTNSFICCTANASKIITRQFWAHSQGEQNRLLLCNSAFFVELDNFVYHLLALAVFNESHHCCRVFYSQVVFVDIVRSLFRTQAYEPTHAVHVRHLILFRAWLVLVW